MNNREWYGYDSAAQTGGERPAAESGAEISPAAAPEKRAKVRRGWTPWRVLGVIGLVMLVIVGSSLLFASTGSSTLPLPAASPEVTAGPELPDFPDLFPDADEPDAEMPDDFTEFFSGFFQTVQSDTVDIRLPRAELPIDFSIALEGHGKRELGMSALYAGCAPSVVGISAYTEGYSGYAWGTGVVLSSDGLILTNTHVIDDSDRATVVLYDDREFEATLVGADAISDLAVLKIDAEGLTPVVFGQSAELRVGDPVAAIGNPLGFEFRNTLTNGLISAIERGVSYNGRTMTLLQTNTALNEGNSGGALFNMYGQVIGITNMKMMSSYSSIEGIGFAIPSATVQKVVDALVRDGEVRGRPAIGITVGSVPEEASSHYEIPEGLYVSAVTPGSDAEKKGIQVGDIITAVDGVAVTTTDEVNDLKNAHAVGETMLFHIWRSGQEMDIEVALMDTNDVYG